MKKILQIASCRGVDIFNSSENVDQQIWMRTPFSTLENIRIGFESLYMLNNTPQHDMLHVEISTLTYCLKNTYHANRSSMLLTDKYISPEDSTLNYPQFEKYMDNLISMVPDHVRFVIQTSHNIQLSDRHCNLIKQSIMNKEHKNLMRGGAGVKEEILAEKLTPCKRFRNRTYCENYVIKYFNKHKHKTTILKTSEIFNGWDSESVFESSNDQHVDTFHYNTEAINHLQKWISDLNL